MNLDGAMHGRAAVPSAAVSRQDGGSPCGRVALRRDRRQDGGSPYRGAHYGEPPSRRLFLEVARDGADSVNCCFEMRHHGEVMLKFAP